MPYLPPATLNCLQYRFANTANISCLHIFYSHAAVPIEMSLLIQTVSQKYVTVSDFAQAHKSPLKMQPVANKLEKLPFILNLFHVNFI